MPSFTKSLQPLRWAASALVLAGLTAPAGAALAQTTPIKYVVVIFQENVSFDHYFATYPQALNAPTDPAGTPQWKPLPNTPSVNGLGPAGSTATLLTHNPNSAQAFRLSPADAVTCDNDNAYDAEQIAANKGLQNQYPQATSAQPTATNTTTHLPCDANLAMGYYDGNTVTAIWNYAQHYAMSDNFFGTEFGTTVMGHLNLLSGQTHVNVTGNPANEPSPVTGFIQNGSVIANVSSALEDCPSKGEATVTMTSKNVGDLLNAQNVTWGWFYGDFPSTPTTKGGPCPSAYNNHYDPFQYWASTANPHHLPPSSLAAIGTSADQANHQYSLDTLTAALNSGNLPAVTFIKAPSTETGHPQKSDPLSEQEFLVWTINELQASPYWKNMAIFITYDDSDGWYDHASAPVVNQSLDPAYDHQCAGPIAPTAYNDRCGYGPRLPLLAISPYAKRNYVDSAVTDQTSVLRFIEANYGLGFIDGPTEPPAGQASFDRVAGSLNGLFDFVDAPNTKPLVLDPSTGVVLSSN
jgi:phospholipase C